MHPRLLTLPAFDFLGRQVGPFSLPTYGVLLALGLLAGLLVASRQARRAGLDAARITDMAVYVVLGGLLGAKVLLVLLEGGHYLRHPSEMLGLLRSGGVFYGGLLGAMAVAVWYARRHAVDGWSAADALAPGVALGQAIGRLGCFAAGCCYGRPTQVPWAVTFTDLNAAREVGTPLDVPLHPTQLYESAATFALFLVLLALCARRTFAGQVVLAYAFLYAVLRGLIEIFRGDAARGTVFGVLSTSQFIALLMGAAAAFLYLRRWKGRPAAAPGL